MLDTNFNCSFDVCWLKIIFKLCIYVNIRGRKRKRENLLVGGEEKLLKFYFCWYMNVCMCVFYFESKEY